MTICDNGHEEIAFASDWAKDCPACAYADEVRSDMQETIDELEDTIETLEAKIEDHECE